MTGGTATSLDPKDVAVAENWFRSQKPQDATKMRPLSVWYVHSPTLTQMGQTSLDCHQLMVWKDDATFYGTGIDYLSQRCDKDKARAWVDWMLGAESPWRVLFKDGICRVFDEDGETVGIILPATAVTYETFNIFKNFAIALRFPREYPAHLNVWHLFASMGLHKADAFYLSRCFAMSARGDLSSYASNCGRHWPLTDAIPLRVGGSIKTLFERTYSGTLAGHRFFEFERFRNGTPYEADDWINGCWCGEVVKSDDVVVWGYRSVTAPFTLQKTGFSTIKLYDPKEILKHFVEWQKSVGVTPALESDDT